MLPFSLLNNRFTLALILRAMKINLTTFIFIVNLTRGGRTEC